MFTSSIFLVHAEVTASHEEVVAVAREGRIHDFITGLLNGYSTKISDENTVFSTGQKELLSIARMILANSTSLVFDEVTSNVDTVTEEKIQKAVIAS